MAVQPETDAATKLVTILISLVVRLIRVKPVALAAHTPALTVVVEPELAATLVRRLPLAVLLHQAALPAAAIGLIGCGAVTITAIMMDVSLAWDMTVQTIEHGIGVLLPEELLYLVIVLVQATREHFRTEAVHLTTVLFMTASIKKRSGIFPTFFLYLKIRNDNSCRHQTYEYHFHILL